MVGFQEIVKAADEYQAAYNKLRSLIEEVVGKETPTLKEHCEIVKKIERMNVAHSAIFFQVYLIVKRIKRWLVVD